MKNIKETISVKSIDAEGRTLGRVASETAVSLMGKTRTSFERNVYSGMPVRVVNASKLSITTKKLAEIYHTRYSGIPGGLRVLKGTETAEKKGMQEKANMKWSVEARVLGGGIHSQAEAIRHGLARALVASDPEVRGSLKDLGYLKRDSRAKERRKFGLKKARK